jgi:hypothetical protein
MLFGKANPNEYLVIGRGGKIVNLGSGVNVFLLPGTIRVVIPGTKQEVGFEMTQESKDGIPLHFKGIVVYRITDPVAAAQNFNFNEGTGLDEISSMIRNICLGELRPTVSGMTMNECIEQRKTILTASVESALRKVILGEGEIAHSKWGIELEIVQVAQVYIVDNELRKQLEAEIRNNIRAESDKSGIRSQEEIKLVQMASERRIQDQKNETEKDAIRRKEAIDLAQIGYHRRIQRETQETDKESILIASEKLRLELEAAKEKTEIEAPVQKLQIENRREVLKGELEMRQIENQVHQLEVNKQVMLETARHELRKDIMPIEQTPAIANALAGIFQDTQLSIYGSDNQIMPVIAPLFATFSKLIQDTLAQRSAANSHETGGKAAAGKP